MNLYFSLLTLTLNGSVHYQPAAAGAFAASGKWKTSLCATIAPKWYEAELHLFPTNIFSNMTTAALSFLFI